MRRGRKRLLADLFEWAQWAALQGTGTEYGTPEWDHWFISTWEDADDILPRVAEHLGIEIGLPE